MLRNMNRRWQLLCVEYNSDQEISLRGLRDTSLQLLGY